MGDQHFPVLIVTVIRIVEGDLTRIVKTASGLFKSDTVLSHIGSGLISVPFEGDQFNFILVIDLSESKQYQSASGWREGIGVNIRAHLPQRSILLPWFPRGMTLWQKVLEAA